MSKEQLDVIDLLISLMREAIDEISHAAEVMNRYIEITEQVDELEMKERFR